jgi:tetratricopeptide (TPR) repeat protein
MPYVEVSDIREEAKGPSWELSLFGTFRLADPLGTPVSLATRKVEGLLAVLEVHRRDGMARDEIAEILWPGRPLELQRSNFRQALSHLRKAIGDSSVETSRVHCRLRSEFPLQSDFEASRRGQPEAFMPGQEGEWFEEIRLRLESNGGSSEPQRSVVEAFSQTLTWFAQNDAKGMFQMLRVSASLARGIRYRELLQLLRVAGNDSALVGWAAYWRGTSEEDLQLCSKLLRFAFSEAKRTEDAELASEVCLELGKVYSRTGQTEKAEEICRMAETIATQSGTVRSRANAAWLRGTVLAQWTERSNSFELMERSEDLTENTIDRAIARSARAFFLVSSGRVSEAKSTLEWSQKVGAGLGHQRLQVVIGMTEAVLSVHGNPRVRAIKDLEAATGYCRSQGSTQFRVYGEELLAKLYHLEGDRGLAEGLSRSAYAGRSGSKMALTPLEVKRVNALL